MIRFKFGKRLIWFVKYGFCTFWIYRVLEFNDELILDLGTSELNVITIRLCVIALIFAIIYDFNFLFEWLSRKLGIGEKEK